MDDQKSSGEQGAGPQQGVKKKYEKPQIVYSAPLEAMAADCSVSPGKGDLACIALNS
jgi:hypothetical protein